MSRSIALGENETEDLLRLDILDLSGKGLKKMDSLPKRSLVSKLVLDHNNITKIEKLETFPKLCWLSMANNHLVRMNGVNFGKNLTNVNLSNNGIISMEGLCWLVHLEYLNLSKNNIKRIENVSYCTKLKYMDLSENSITDISDLKNLVHLKVLLLHGNAITTLQRAEENLPELLETLFLADNGIPDLNEVCHLSCLPRLKHLSILNNPCVMMTTSLPCFDYRPFILSCCLALSSVDDDVVTKTERNDAESLRRDENLSLFFLGHHMQLILYLSKVCPLKSSPQLDDDQEKFLDNFLEEQRLQKFTPKQKTEICENSHSFMNGEQEQVKTSDSKLSKTLECPGLDQSDLPVSFTPEYTTSNERRLSEEEEDDERDLLCSESSFLPVYSPIKKSVQQSIQADSRDYPTDSEQSVRWDEDLDQVSAPDDEDLPIMTEEEANKLIHLAATILQAHIRGFLVRQKFDFKDFKRKHEAASKIQAFWKGYYFRHRSYQGSNFKNELRIQRLQKYVATLCIMMQKAEKQHAVEKQQLLEAVTLLYDKFTRLSDKVEQQTLGNKKERDKLERKAAILLQKHWRGYVVRKHSSRLMSTNPLESLLKSHIQLQNKVNYLESLVVNTEKRENETCIRVQLDPAFLPHPRLFGEDERKEKEEWNEISGNEDAKKSLNEDVKERECAERNQLVVVDGQMKVFENKDEYTVDVEDGRELLEDNTEGVALDNKELHFLNNEVNREKFENLEDEVMEKSEVIREIPDEKQLNRDIKDGRHQDDVEQQIIQSDHEESEDKDDKNRVTEDQAGNNVTEGISQNNEIVVDNKVENIPEEGQFTTKVNGEGKSSGQEVIDSIDKEPESHENHFNEDVKFNELQDDKSGTVMETKDWNIKHDKEQTVMVGENGNMVDVKEDRIVNDAEKSTTECTSLPELQKVTSKTQESPLRDKPNNSSDVEHFKTFQDPQESSTGITKNVEVPVQNSDISDLGSCNNQEDEITNNESYQGDNEQKCLIENSNTSDTDTTRVSPRLGQRASNLLSALKTEISKVSLQSSDGDESSSAQLASRASSSDTPEAVIIDNSDSSLGHITVTSEIEETLSVNDGNSEESNEVNLES